MNRRFEVRSEFGRNFNIVAHYGAPTPQAAADRLRHEWGIHPSYPVRVVETSAAEVKEIVL